MYTVRTGSIVNDGVLHTAQVFNKGANHRIYFIFIPMITCLWVEVSVNVP